MTKRNKSKAPKRKNRAAAGTPPKTKADKAGKRPVPLRYKIALPLFGILLLVVLEILLRVFGFGSSYPLFERDKREDGTPIYRLNPEASERFFFRRFEGRPVAPSRVLPVEFPVEKPEGAIRIFALGGSTTAGFPYPRSASFSGFLQAMLRDLHPDRGIEVINCGLTALNSHAVLAFLPEVLDCEPDLVVVYSAHNEFYGAHGVGSLERVAANRQLIRFFMALQKLRLFQLISSAREALRKPAEGGSETELIRVMARDQEIRRDSRKFRIAERNFRNNMESITRKCRRTGVPLVLCTVASNVRDLSPLRSAHRQGIGEDELERWNRLWDQALASWHDGELAAAAEVFQRLLEIDSEYAETHFRLARCEEAAEQWDAARPHFEQALIHDALRFRATPAFSEILREVAAGATESNSDASVILADIEAAFAREAKGGVPGYDLMTDHLHPNARGNFLIGRTLCEALAGSPMAGRFGDPWDWTRLKTLAQYEPEVGLSAVERFLVAQILYGLYQDFPFKTQIDREAKTAELQRNFADALQQLGPREIQQLAEWSGRRHTFDLHAQLAEGYRQAGDWAKAAEHFRLATRQVGQASPGQYQAVWAGLGDCERSLGNPEAAADAYRQALKYPGSEAELTYNLARIQLESGNHERAIELLEKAVELRPDDGDTLISLGLAWRARGERDQARQYFEKAAAIEDSQIPANYHLATEELARGEADAAIARLQQVIQWEPNHVQSLRLLGYAHLQQKQYKHAIDAFEKSLAIDDQNAAAWYNSAVAHSALGNIDEGLECLRKLVEVDPDMRMRIALDDSFKPLWKRPEFRLLLREPGSPAVDSNDESTTAPATVDGG